MNDIVSQSPMAGGNTCLYTLRSQVQAVRVGTIDGMTDWLFLRLFRLLEFEVLLLVSRGCFLIRAGLRCEA